VQSPSSSHIPDVLQTRASTLLIDLQFLLDRRLYHQLPSDEVAPGFADSKHQPPLGASLESLIQAGHFRRAAETALIDLLSSSASDANRIFKLLYTRLACLVVISRPELAADESVPLTEFLNRNTPDAKDILPLVPWELRLLLVRLQSIAASDDGRRAIMSLYALASEVRSHLSDAKADNDQTSVQAWSERLSDLGLRVADTLVETGELETAARHLDTLSGIPPDVINSRKALLSLRTGDLGSAEESLAKMTPGLSKYIHQALLQTTEGDFTKAVEAWRQLAEQHPDNELLGQNLSACLLYTGHITEARSVLEGIVRDTPAFPALLFNLSTVYELCTNRAVERKTGLSHFLAQRSPPAAAMNGGWERTNADFKL
jgi:tetratricopeptide (TPR) repeat protein